MRVCLLTLTVVCSVILASAAQAPFTLTLTSNDVSQDIPQLPACSCQLVAFPVYNFTYSILVTARSTDHTHANIYLSSGKCGLVKLKRGTAVLQVEGVKQLSCQTAVTVSIYIDLVTVTDPNDTCRAEKTGWQRSVYLVNKSVGNDFSYNMALPKNAMWITELIAFLLLCLLSQNIKYRRILPLTFGFGFAIIYTAILFITVYVESYITDRSGIIYWLTNAFGFFCLFLYLTDIATILFDRVPHIIISAVLATSALAVVDLIILPNAWFLNDIVAICLAGAIIKFIVVKKLKTAALPMLFLWAFFVVRQFAITFHIQKFEQVLKIKIIPFFLQIPGILGDDQQGYICSAFGTSKIITMGLLFNYAVRVDLFLSTKFYTVLCILVALVCMGIEMILSLLLDEIPIMDYTSVILFLPISFALLLMFGSKRGEWGQIWHGSFHDIAVNRKSINKSSTLLDDEDISRNLQQLKMSADLLSDR